ncbi:MAG: pyrimidine 5'-nucleotidase [Chloroflexota bacterium]|nr:pyrimidine 5'-nucleotidase [Chloroflexota bacterium]
MLSDTTTRDPREGGLTDLLFDLDETLYPRESGLMGAINERISLYMLERMGMEPDLVRRLRPEYFRKYGTTMRGLAIHHNLDCDDYLTFVHDVPVEDYIKPDPELDAALARIPWRLSIFTNASEAHARRVLAALGVSRHFGHIFDVAAVDYQGKPAVSAYLKVLAVLSARPAECVMADDSVSNLAPAKDLGLVTVLVDDRQRGPVSGADILVAKAAQVADMVADLQAGTRKWVCGPVTLIQRQLL